MPRRNILILVLLVVVALLCRERVQKNPYVRVLAGAMGKIENMALDPVDEQQLFEGAMEGMLAQLDEHSRYFSPEEFKKFHEEVDLQFGGIGIDFTQDTKTKELIVSPAMSSPAAKAGIRTGDKVLRIGNANARGMSANDVVALLRGRPGTPVTLTVQHQGNSTPRDITIVRDVVQGDSVRGDIRNGDGSWEFVLDGRNRIGYVRITASFTDNTVNELRQALAWATQHDKIRGLVLDLRDNPGGYLEAGVDVCDLLIKSGDIVTTLGRHASKTRRASGRAQFTDLPMAVLVNNQTASAAEIVAACLQDHERAKVFGERTYGKGTVQEIIQLEGGCGGMKLTTKSYWRPSGKNIQRPRDATDKDTWGVSPNEGCKIDLTDEEANQWRDWRSRRDVLPVLAGDGKAFVDRPLLRAVEYVEKEAATRESRKPAKP
jgi:carboxyl-terminal processing protease